MSPCDPYEGETEVSDREHVKAMAAAWERIEGDPYEVPVADESEGMTWADMFSVVYDEVIAPLLAEAERRGAEKGWDEGMPAGYDYAQGHLDGLRNPYRAGTDQ